MHGGLLRVVWDPRPARRERGRAWDGVAAELLGEPEPADEEPEQEAEEEQEQPPDEAEKGDSVEDGGPAIWINAPRGQHDADSGSGRGSGAYRGRIYGEIFFAPSQRHYSHRKLRWKPNPLGPSFFTVSVELQIS